MRHFKNFDGMSHPVIKVESLAKRYRLGVVGATTLREDLGRLGRKLRGDEPEPDRNEFWALRDVSFQVHPGEVVGVIGRNGAGKSTLLKILSRITDPTHGRVVLRGRMASLLEVGTGFHPDLTGRENVFLNGAILGMKQPEIRRCFDEIVAFAEVEKFIDTPVKHYSSGMYVRLAFAVAAHLEPEILVIDEVLAVGDVQFQQKCLGKMQDVASNHGRTIIFVSHHMPSIQRLCQRVVALRQGSVVEVGPTASVVSGYLNDAAPKIDSTDLEHASADRRHGSGRIRFVRVELIGAGERKSAEFRWGEPLVVRLHVDATIALNEVVVGFSFIALDGTEVLGTSINDFGAPGRIAVGRQVFTCEVRPMVLCPGRYYIRAAIFSQTEVFDHIDEMLGFDVIKFAYDLNAMPPNHLVGHVHLPYHWRHEIAPTITS